MIEQSPGQNLTIASLSRIAGLSESHFIRLFSATYGISPRKLLSQQRLRASKSLIGQGKDLAEVAYAIGYSSVPTFCRRFKEAFGVTPKEFKKRNLG
jgi:AraC-like DNA-binding protein